MGLDTGILFLCPLGPIMKDLTNKIGGAVLCYVNFQSTNFDARELAYQS